AGCCCRGRWVGGRPEGASGCVPLLAFHCARDRARADSAAVIAGILINREIARGISGRGDTPCDAHASVPSRPCNLTAKLPLAIGAVAGSAGLVVPAHAPAHHRRGPLPAVEPALL